MLIVIIGPTRRVVKGKIEPTKLSILNPSLFQPTPIKRFKINSPYMSACLLPIVLAMKAQEGATEPHRPNSLKRFNDEQDPFAQPILVTFHR